MKQTSMNQGMAISLGRASRFTVIAAVAAMMSGEIAFAQPRSGGGGGADRIAHARNAPKPTLAMWREMDDELLFGAKQFVELVERRHPLFQKLGKLNRRRPSPDDVSPGAILHRRNVSEILAEYDELQSETRDVQRRAWRVTHMAFTMRSEMIALLEARQEALKNGRRGDRARRLELERIDKWLASLGQAQHDWQVVRGILGRDLGGFLLYGFGASEWLAPRQRSGRPESARLSTFSGPEEERKALAENLEQLRGNNARFRERIRTREAEIRKIEARLAALGAATPVIGEPDK